MSRPAWQDEDAREADGRFPSGRWRGYWLQDGQRGQMELHLTFGDGRLFGEGRDEIGDFIINGGYDCASGHCALRKVYLGKHDVDYDGVAGANGIRGIWRIFEPGTRVTFAAGLFHIWPVGDGIGASLETKAEEPVPV